MPLINTYVNIQNNLTYSRAYYHPTQKVSGEILWVKKVNKDIRNQQGELK